MKGTLLVLAVIMVALPIVALAETGHDTDGDHVSVYGIVPGPEDHTLMEMNDSASLVLDSVGEFVYHCHPHEVLGMYGNITVVHADDVTNNTLSGIVHVDMFDYYFTEEEIEVVSGTNITWHNHVTAGHNVIISAADHGEEHHEEESGGFLPLPGWIGFTALLSAALILVLVRQSRF